MAHPNQPYDPNYYQIASPGASLYVGNMDRRLTEPLFLTLLFRFFPNQVLACKFFDEPNGGDPYCFIMFSDPNVASAALNILNGRTIYEKKLRVNWACPPTAPKQGPQVENEGHAIYVGDLGSDIDDKTLLASFQTFGEVRGAKIVRDADTGNSKGYGFVVFNLRSDAELAIAKMNGHLLGTKPVKVGWATRSKSGQTNAPLNYSDVYVQAPENNSTIYVGGLPKDMDESACRHFFEPYGVIIDCKFHTDRQFAFITYESHAAATNAIIKCNGHVLEGSMIRCWWSKENQNSPNYPGPYSVPQYMPPPVMFPPGQAVPPSQYPQMYMPSQMNPNYPPYNPNYPPSI